MFSLFNLGQKSEEEICGLIEKNPDALLRREALEEAYFRDFPKVFQQLLQQPTKFREVAVQDAERRDSFNCLVGYLFAGSDESMITLLKNPKDAETIFLAIRDISKLKRPYVYGNFYRRLFDYQVSLDRFKLLLGFKECQAYIKKALSTAEVNVTLNSFENLAELCRYPAFFPLPSKIALPYSKPEAINNVLTQLKERKAKSTTPIFNVTSSEAKALLYVVDYMLKIPLEGKSEALKFLLMIPQVHKQAHLALDQKTENTLLLTACAYPDREILLQLLALPTVAELAQKSKFYSNQMLADLFLERKQSMSAGSSDLNKDASGTSLKGFFSKLNDTFFGASHPSESLHQDSSPTCKPLLS